jgi:hypothetical protein
LKVPPSTPTFTLPLQFDIADKYAIAWTRAGAAHGLLEAHAP